ncbi:hypothetical protein QZH41_014511, partial [Actinostola sp. cb2023]
EYALLLEENESFQRQFQAQEENFKLQNQTLLLEITRLSEENDSLQRDYEKLHKIGSQESGSSDGEIIRLRAENAALQKSLANAQERYEQELNALQNQAQPATEFGNNLSTTTSSEFIDPLTESSNEAEHDLTDKLQSILNEEFNKLSQNLKLNKDSEERQVNGESSTESENEKDSNNDQEEAISKGDNDSRNVDNMKSELRTVQDRLIEALVPLLSLSAENSHVNGSGKPNKELLQQNGM